MIIVTIAATRMYRSLINIFSSDISHDGHQGGARTVSDMRVRPGPVPFNSMEVSVRTEYERYLPSQTSPSGSSVSTEPKEHYKAHEVSFDGDIESGHEK